LSKDEWAETHSLNDTSNMYSSSDHLYLYRSSQ
jgi:hypothetical protein